MASITFLDAYEKMLTFQGAPDDGKQGPAAAFVQALDEAALETPLDWLAAVSICRELIASHSGKPGDGFLHDLADNVLQRLEAQARTMTWFDGENASPSDVLH